MHRQSGLGVQRDTKMISQVNIHESGLWDYVVGWEGDCRGECGRDGVVGESSDGVRKQRGRGRRRLYEGELSCAKSECVRGTETETHVRIGSPILIYV